MRRIQEVTPLQGYEPEIGRWLWMLQEVRRRTLRLVEGLDQRTLDWEGPDGWENAIGSLLYHIAAVELGWLFFDIFGEQDFPADLKPEFPHDLADSSGHLTRVPGVALSEHLRRLELSRNMFLDKVRLISIEEWRRLRRPPDDVDYDVTPEWAVFHLVEHEAGHAFQISSLKRRAARFFAVPA